MARTRIEYTIIAEIDHKKIPAKILPVFSKLKIGDKFTPKSLFDKYGCEIDIASDHYTMLEISRTSRIACQENMLERINSLSAPRWFKDLETIFWQSQLRGRKFKNRHASNTASTKSQYLYCLWCFNKWLCGKEFQIRDFRCSI